MKGKQLYESSYYGMSWNLMEEFVLHFISQGNAILFFYVVHVKQNNSFIRSWKAILFFHLIINTGGYSSLIVKEKGCTLELLFKEGFILFMQYQR